MDIYKIMMWLKNRFPDGFKLHFSEREGKNELDDSYTIDLFLNGKWELKAYTGYIKDLIYQIELDN